LDDVFMAFDTVRDRMLTPTFRNKVDGIIRLLNYVQIEAEF